MFNVLCSDIFFYISIRWTFFKVVAKKIFGWFAQSYLVNFKELIFFFPDFLVKGHSSRTIFQPLSREFFIFLKVFSNLSTFPLRPVPQRNFGSSWKGRPLRTIPFSLSSCFFNFFSKNFFLFIPEWLSPLVREKVAHYATSPIHCQLLFLKNFQLYRKLLSINKKIFLKIGDFLTFMLWKNAYK